MDNTLNLLKQIIRTVPNYVFWKDRNLIYRGANLNFAKSLGFDEVNLLIGKRDEEIEGTRTFAQMYHDEDLYILTTGESILNKEVRLQLAEKERMLSISKVPLFDEAGSISGILGIFIDITHFKENELILAKEKEKAESASRAKTEFLENMRHDIRTPLTGIVGFSELIKTEINNPQVSEYAENLIASSHALLELLDEVLEAIRVSSGEIPKLKKKFSLNHMAQQIIDLNRAKAAEKKLKLTLSVDKALPRFVIGDKVRVHRVALELVSNALNFTDSGFVTLTISLAKKTSKRIIIKLIVEDSGMGIPKEKQQEIYIQFKRLTPSYQGIYKGAGLGLSVVKQFIDELDGEIYVESDSKKGSRFTCIIPLQKPLLDESLGVDEELEHEFTSASIIHKQPIMSTHSKQIQRALIVEDNPIAQTIAKSLLKSLDWYSDIAPTGTQALALYKRNDYKLILMDIGLPDIDGYEVTRKIRIHELTKQIHIPIIALTAHAGDERKQRCIEAGMNAVLTKPLTLKNCTDMIDAFISRDVPPSQSLLNSKNDKPSTQFFDLDEFPHLDIEVGIKTMGSKEILAEMLRFLLKDSLPNDLMMLKEAYQATDWDKVQQLAHKIKGGAVYVGTVKLSMACQYLERYQKSGETQLIEPLYKQTLLVANDTITQVSIWLDSISNQ